MPPASATYVGPSTAPAPPLNARRLKQTIDATTWMYDLEPAHVLPTLDLARTVQSEFYSTRMNAAYRTLKRHGGLLVLAYMITTLSYLGSLLTSATVGGYIAVFGAVVGLPGNFLTLGQLRFDILKLLAGCFDVWLTSLIQCFVFAVLAVMLGDLRAAISVSFWLGSWPNICSDAVLVAIRPIVVFSAICVVTSTFIVIGVNVNMIDRLRDIQVLQYGANYLPGRAAVTDGFGTVAALMLRNVYRRRVLFQRRRRSNDLECVVYRCRLCLVPYNQRRRPLNATDSRGVVGKPTDASRTHIQPMRFIPSQRKIDARDTVAPSAFTFITANPRCDRVWPVIASLAVLLTITSTALVIFSNGMTKPLRLAVFWTALALTVANTVISWCLFQRQLLRIVCTSFDFIFLATQLTILHVSACSLFGWTQSSVMLGLLSWQWVIWVLLLDTLTPPVKKFLRIHRLFPRFIYVCSLCSACLLVYMMVFATPPAQAADRVIWSGTVMGQTVAFRVFPQFYSALMMSFVYTLRYAWRQCWFAPNDLVVIDGTVVFRNSLRRPRASRTQIEPSANTVPVTQLRPQTVT